MQPIELIPVALSLDLTGALVAAGLRAPWTAGEEVGDPAVYELDVLDASNTTPIVVTVAANLGGAIPLRTGRVYHVVISGVQGNTAANKTDPLSLRDQAWIAIVTSAEDAAATTLALYDLSVIDGTLIPSVGNGAYTGGGTVSKALIDGQILLGQEFIGETSAAPRIVMVPKRCAYSSRAESSSLSALAIASGEQRREELAPSLMTREITYEVHVWGKGPSVSASFGVVDLMADQLIRSAQDRMAGVFAAESGTYLDQVEGAPQRLKFGHEYVFGFTANVPIPRDAAILAPEGVAVAPDLYMQINGGTPEPVNEE